LQLDLPAHVWRLVVTIENLLSLSGRKFIRRSGDQSCLRSFNCHQRYPFSLDQM
jgi:hypothetical protein